MISAVLRELMAAGLSGEQLLAAVERIEAAELLTNSTGIPPDFPVDKAAEKRRAYDRERKRIPRNSTGIPPEIPPDARSALSYKEKERATRKVGMTIPPEWSPSESHFLEGRQLGLDAAMIRSQAQDMILWARANEHRAVARKLDWNSTFSGWMRRNSRDRKSKNGPIDPGRGIL